MTTDIKKVNNISSKRLLIIDDEENMRHMLTSMFSNSDYRVDTAADGYEGLQMIDQMKYDFSCSFFSSA